MTRVLIIDETKENNEFLKNVLEGRGHEVLFVHTEAEIKEVLRNNSLDLSICKVLTNDSPIFTILKECQSMGLNINPCIFITKQEIDIPTAQKMLNLGVATFLTEPPEVGLILNAIEETLAKGLENKKIDTSVQELQEENENLKRQLEAKIQLCHYMQKNTHFNSELEPSLDILGESNAMLSVRNTVKRLSKTSLGSRMNIFISGPVGSGKEILARLIHNLSTEKDSLWIPFDCSKDDNWEDMDKKIFSSYESEKLYRKAGLLEMAHNSCIFLNEITDLPVPIQEKLCDVLQKKNTEIPSKHIAGKRFRFRILSSSSKDMQECIENGIFLESLYEQLNSVTIDLPPLCKQAPEDILNLAKYFLQEVTQEADLLSMKLEGETNTLLTEYDWPGNVKELRSVIRRAAILTTGNILTASSIQASMNRHSPTPLSSVRSTSNVEHIHLSLSKANMSLQGLHNIPYHTWKRDTIMQMEEEYLKEQLRNYEGNCSAIAKIMQITRPNLCRLLKKHNLSAKKYRLLRKKKIEAA